jgi:hypothetical protein
MVVQLRSVVLSKTRGLGKDLNKIRRVAMRDVGEFWHLEILPGHFRPAARTEYNHDQRRADWIEDKRKILGGGRPDNVFTGRARRFIMHSPRITNTARGVTVRMDAPLYFVRPRNRKPDHPDKAAEITAISQRDRDAIFGRTSKLVVRLSNQSLQNTALRKVFNR